MSSARWRAVWEGCRLLQRLELSSEACHFRRHMCGVVRTRLHLGTLVCTPSVCTTEYECIRTHAICMLGGAVGFFTLFTNMSSFCETIFDHSYAGTVAFLCK